MLSENDVKAELSYAYLHAVAAQARFGCSVTDRHLDGSGVDAQVNVKERLDPDSEYTEFSLHFQLKATSQELAIVNEALSFHMEVPHYNKLRQTSVYVPRLVLVLHLPVNSADWLDVTADRLVAQRCGRWMSLRGAPETANIGTVAVHLPMENVLTPVALREIARRHSLGEEINYEQ